MAKTDNFARILMLYPNVKLECDGVILECKYIRVDGKDYSEWWVNGFNTGMQVTELIKGLREKNKPVKVLWKRSY